MGVRKVNSRTSYFLLQAALQRGVQAVYYRISALYLSNFVHRVAC
jgi:hypothetical protein